MFLVVVINQVDVLIPASSDVMVQVTSDFNNINYSL